MSSEKSMDFWSNMHQYTVIISAQLLKHLDFYSQSNKRVGVISDVFFC